MKIFSRLLPLAVVITAAVSVTSALLEPPSLFVEGYAGRVSYVAGEHVELHVSTSASTYDIEIARLGAQRKVVLTRDDLPS